MQRYLRLILTIMALIPAGSNAQTPPAIEGPVYIATYVEVVPTAADEGAALLKQYRDAWDLLWSAAPVGGEESPKQALT